MADTSSLDHDYAEDVIDDNRIHIPLPSLTDPKDVPPDQGDKGSV